MKIILQVESWSGEKSIGSGRPKINGLTIFRSLDFFMLRPKTTAGGKFTAPPPWRINTALKTSSAKNFMFFKIILSAMKSGRTRQKNIHSKNYELHFDFIYHTDVLANVKMYDYQQVIRRLDWWFGHGMVSWRVMKRAGTISQVPLHWPSHILWHINQFCLEIILFNCREEA